MVFILNLIYIFNHDNWKINKKKKQYNISIIHTIKYPIVIKK